MKVFQINDCDWVAAETLEQAVAWYQATGEAPEDEYELDAEEMQRRQFLDTDGVFGPEKAVYSFQAALALMTADGDTEPFLFASTEY